MRASFLVSSFVVASSVIGCGSSPSASVFDDKPDGATVADSATVGDDSSTVGDSTPIDDSIAIDGTSPDTAVPDTATPTSLDNVCDRLPDAVCTKKLETCCTSKSVDYDKSACRNAIKSSCEDRVAAVKAGDATFDATAFAACAAAWSTLSTKCSVPILDYVKGYAPCQQLFDGKVAPNGHCDKDEDCHASAGQWVNCSTDGDRCTAFTIPNTGAMCGYGTSTAAICDYGLACNYTTMSSGTCKAAKPAGAACAQDFECGFTFYCKKPGFGGTGVCAAGLAEGTPCTSGGACASARCDAGLCTNPNVEIAIPEICGG